MKKFIVLSVATLAVGCSFMDRGCDPHEHKHNHGQFGMRLFDRMDINDDGIVTKKELEIHQKDIFNSIDTNGDGKITLAEAKKADRQKSYDRLSNKAKKGYLTFKDIFGVEEKRFTDADADHNGKVTKEEYKAHYLRSFKDKK